MLNKSIILFLSSVLILASSAPLLAAGEKTEGPKDQAVQVETKTKTITEIKGGKKIITRIARFTVRRSDPYTQDFNIGDYKKALQSDKLIVLLFCTKGSKQSEKEFDHLKAAFKKIERGRIVGFKVNFKDKNSDRAENKLAKAFKVKKAGTKIFIKNGGKLKQTAKYWNTKDYIKNITAAQKK